MRKRIQPVVILLFLQVFGNRLDGAGQGASDIGQGHGEGADRFAGKLLRGIRHMEKAAAQAGIFERRRMQQRIQKADRKSTRLNSSHRSLSRMPSSA